MPAYRKQDEILLGKDYLQERAAMGNFGTVEGMTGGGNGTTRPNASTYSREYRLLTLITPTHVCIERDENSVQIPLHRESLRLARRVVRAPAF